MPLPAAIRFVKVYVCRGCNAKVDPQGGHACFGGSLGIHFLENQRVKVNAPFEHWHESHGCAECTARLCNVCVAEFPIVKLETGVALCQWCLYRHVAGEELEVVEYAAHTPTPTEKDRAGVALKGMGIKPSRVTHQRHQERASKQRWKNGKQYDGW